MNPQDSIFGIGIVGMGPESAGPIDLESDSAGLNRKGIPKGKGF
jgi:hypothetical protein